MASARNINDPGNYALEQWSLEQSRLYQAYKYQPNGEAITTQFAGNGLIGSWLPRNLLSSNSVDIESLLRGTGSTNLVNPKPEIKPLITPHTSLSIADRIPLVIPKPLYVEPNQRPTW